MCQKETLAPKASDWHFPQTSYRFRSTNALRPCFSINNCWTVFRLVSLTIAAHSIDGS